MDICDGFSIAYRFWARAIFRNRFYHVPWQSRASETGVKSWPRSSPSTLNCKKCVDHTLTSSTCEGSKSSKHARARECLGESGLHRFPGNAQGGYSIWVPIPRTFFRTVSQYQNIKGVLTSYLSEDLFFEVFPVSVK